MVAQEYRVMQVLYFNSTTMIVTMKLESGIRIEIGIYYKRTTTIKSIQARNKQSIKIC
jgi:hypothetical protein